jgi:anti-sigma factor RsiW
MMNPSCDTVRDRLPEFVREVLPASEMAVVAAHLETCGECGGELRVVRMVALPRAVLPAGFEQRVVRAVRTRRSPVFSPGRLAMAATVVFALVTAGVIRQTGLLDGSSRGSEDLAGVQSVDWTRGDPVLLRGGLDLSTLSEDELLKLLEEMDS